MLYYLSKLPLVEKNMLLILVGNKRDLIPICSTLLSLLVWSYLAYVFHSNSLSVSSFCPQSQSILMPLDHHVKIIDELWKTFNNYDSKLAQNNF